jgi:hypothetical protein
VSIRNSFQMKLMKVNCNLKSILNKGFEHDTELWLMWLAHPQTRNRQFAWPVASSSAEERGQTTERWYIRLNETYPAIEWPGAWKPTESQLPWYRTWWWVVVSTTLRSSANVVYVSQWNPNKSHTDDNHLKTMLIVFSSVYGAIFIDWLPPGEKFNNGQFWEHDSGRFLRSCTADDLWVLQDRQCILTIPDLIGEPWLRTIFRVASSVMLPIQPLHQSMRHLSIRWSKSETQRWRIRDYGRIVREGWRVLGRVSPETMPQVYEHWIERLDQVIRTDGDYIQSQFSWYPFYLWGVTASWFGMNSFRTLNIFMSEAPI